MKKYVSFLLTIMLLSTVLATPVMATENTKDVLEVFEDGSYLAMENTEVITSTTRSSTISKSASSTLVYYNGNDVEQWRYTLYATFLYREGDSAQCQNRSDSYKISNSEWSMKSHDSWVDYDSAFGTITMKKTVLLLPIRTVTETISMTCDAYGNITYDP